MSVPIYAPKGQDLSIVHVWHQGKIYDAKVVQIIFENSVPMIYAEIHLGSCMLTTKYTFDAASNTWYQTHPVAM